MERKCFYELCTFLSRDLEKTNLEDMNTTNIKATSEPCSLSSNQTLVLSPPTGIVLKKTKKQRHWTLLDDALLTGVVMDTYTRRHSLRLGRREFTCDRKAETSNPVWKGIERRYNVARRRYNTLTGKTLTKRTVRALQKRWKVVDKSEENAVDPYGCFLVAVSKSKKMEKLWETYLNKGKLLTCTELEFQNYVATQPGDMKDLSPKL